MEKLTVAVDLGYMWSKAVCGPRRWVEASLVGPRGPEIHGLLPPHGMRVWDGPDEYFIGRLAAEHSAIPWHSLGDAKPDDPNTVRLLHAAIAAVVEPRNGSVPLEVIVSGLPVNLCETQRSSLERVLYNLRGTEVRAQVGSERVHLTLLGPRHVRVLPQPFGSYLAVVLGDNGQVIRPDIAERRVLVIDVGFHTTDLLAVEGLRIRSNRSMSNNFGLATALSTAAKQMNKEVWEVELLARHGRVPGLDAAYRHLAGAINRAVGSLNEPFDLYLVTGGGSLPLTPYLLPQLPKEMVPDPQMANVLGYQKAGERIRRESVG